jgi:hypothetical protein
VDAYNDEEQETGFQVSAEEALVPATALTQALETAAERADGIDDCLLRHARLSRRNRVLG